MKGKVASKVVDYAVEAEKQVSEFLLESIGE